MFLWVYYSYLKHRHTGHSPAYRTPLPPNDKTPQPFKGGGVSCQCSVWLSGPRGAARDALVVLVVLVDAVAHLLAQTPGRDEVLDDRARLVSRPEVLVKVAEARGPNIETDGFIIMGGWTATLEF